MFWLVFTLLPTTVWSTLSAFLQVGFRVLSACYLLPGVERFIIGAHSD